MKITGVSTFHVKPRWLFVKVTTDSGLTGWGEACAGGHARTVAQAVMDLQAMLLGHDPELIEHVWQMLYHGAVRRGGAILMSALSAIEQALWDIKGKAHDLPVYQMLGGSCRTRIRMYTACGGLTPHDSAFQAKGLRLKGYTAIKANVEGVVRSLDTLEFVEKHVARLAAIRTELGSTIDLSVDFQGHLSPAMARRLIARIEPLFPMFIEEPITADGAAALAALAADSSVPLATGKKLYARPSFLEALERHAAAVLQPGVAIAGGILELRKIAVLAETYDAVIAPHCPLGPIALAASLQVAACTPNFLVLEHLGMPNKWDLGLGYLANPFNVREGYIEVPKGPGLGIVLDEGALTERACDGDIREPFHQHPEDHSVAN